MYVHLRLVFVSLRDTAELIFRKGTQLTRLLNTILCLVSIYPDMNRVLTFCARICVHRESLAEWNAEESDVNNI